MSVPWLVTFWGNKMNCGFALMSFSGATTVLSSRRNPIKLYPPKIGALDQFCLTKWASWRLLSSIWSPRLKSLGVKRAPSRSGKMTVSRNKRTLIWRKSSIVKTYKLSSCRFRCSPWIRWAGSCRIDSTSWPLKERHRSGKRTKFRSYQSRSKNYKPISSKKFRQKISA